MIKKLFGQFLLLLVMINFTGIPYALHYCGMMGAFSHSECAMCMEQKREKAEPSCCEEEVSDFPVAFTSDMKCCKEHIVAQPLIYDAEHVVKTGEKSVAQKTIPAAAISQNVIVYNGNSARVQSHGPPPGMHALSIPIRYSSLLI